MEDEPTLRNRLHPRPDIRQKGSDPEETIVAVRKSAEHSAAAGYGRRHEANSLNTKLSTDYTDKLKTICFLNLCNLWMVLLAAPGRKRAAAGAAAFGDDFGEN